ncbi:hypothetical protein RB623_03020 [Mesorhizobium sp. LHD-90]|uniref:hypothetical protein n=1 Tax=Mesorhizobium sp. LHD-90 TaxID=3071414 RepID=UPI0027E16BAA|nr:hypothetical protein [Mesorhizobium sp. LHD-90]MDQ6433021.1 hypothetical protein [Mesorhizobium sp. LHD-90]
MSKKGYQTKLLKMRGEDFRTSLFANLLVLGTLSAAYAHPICNAPDKANDYVAQWTEALVLAKCGPELLEENGKKREMGCDAMREPLDRVLAEAKRRFNLDSPNYPTQKEIEEYCEILDKERMDRPF